MSHRSSVSTRARRCIPDSRSRLVHLETKSRHSRGVTKGANKREMVRSRQPSGGHRLSGGKGKGVMQAPLFLAAFLRGKKVISNLDEDGQSSFGAQMVSARYEKESGEESQQKQQLCGLLWQPLE